MNSENTEILFILNRRKREIVQTRLFSSATSSYSLNLVPKEQALIDLLSSYQLAFRLLEDS